MSATTRRNHRAATSAVNALRARFTDVNAPVPAPDTPDAIDVVIDGETGQYRVRLTSLPMDLEIDVHARHHGADWGSMPGLAASVGHDFGAAAPSQRAITHALTTVAVRLQAFEQSGPFLAVGARMLANPLNEGAQCTPQGASSSRQPSPLMNHLTTGSAT